MTPLDLDGTDPGLLLSHLAAYGMAAIAEDAGAEVRLGWTGGMAPCPRLWLAPTRGEDWLAETIQRVARSHVDPESWIQRDGAIGGAPRGLMSPRVSRLEDPEAWRVWQAQRWRALDELGERGATLDLRLLDALGEPCYWRFEKGNPRQDDAASRLEMQPRNRGSEIVSSKLRKLAEVVSARSIEAIRDGLLGRVIEDELGCNDGQSLSATGFKLPGPADNVLVWCAMWGLALLPTTLCISAQARTAGVLSRRWPRTAYLPIWRHPWRLSRLRAVLVSASLERSAEARTKGDIAVADDAWLAARGVEALALFDIRKYGTSDAPQPRAHPANIQPLTSTPALGARA